MQQITKASKQKIVAGFIPALMASAGYSNIVFASTALSVGTGLVSNGLNLASNFFAPFTVNLPPESKDTNVVKKDPKIDLGSSKGFYNFRLR